MNAGNEIAVGEIVAMLANRAEELCRVLLPNGRREGAEWRVGSIRGETGDSLGVHLSGHKRGVWADFASDDDRGDLLDLIAAIHRCSKGDAVAWAKVWLGLDNDAQARLSKSETAPRGASTKVPSEDEFDMVAWARAKWRAAQPIEGTIGEVYFRKRGITVPLPPTLRFAPSLLHKKTSLYFPAVILAVQEPGNQVSGIHRLYLSLDGRNKAPVDRPKMRGGKVPGGATRLAPAATRLGLAEGVENGLSAMEIYGLPIWSVLAASNFGGVELPPEVEEVVMFVDGDLPGSESYKGTARQALALMQRGLKVEIARPPVGQDFNDILRGSVEPPELKEAAHV